MMAAANAARMGPGMQPMMYPGAPPNPAYLPPMMQPPVAPLVY